jgi:8-oxo-dGTP pyrophosphatase MutT (NUDIX family)
LEQWRILPAERRVTLAERLRAALIRGGDEVPTGDHPDLLLRDDMTPAAVLIAITDRAAPGVILTQRTDTLRRHAGQVAFPGGRIDPGEDAVTAALREADEEIALPASAVTVVGSLDRYRTGTGYEITPVIGVVAPDRTLVPSEAEVASVFEVPLAFLLDPANHHPGRGVWRGEERRFVEIPWSDYRIWGATAGIVVNLSRRLSW